MSENTKKRAAEPTQDEKKRIRLIMELRNKGITDMDVLSVMERVPRDVFVPDDVRESAWDDIALPIGRGQTISQPFIVASMTAALQLKPTDTVLEIGTGCGYQTAILAQLCSRVLTIERHKPLSESASARLKDLDAWNVRTMAGDGMLGWPSVKGITPPSFDKIILTAAARGAPPQALKDQLKIGGIMVAPVATPDGQQSLISYKRESADTFAVQNLMPVRFVPLLPDVAV